MGILNFVFDRSRYDVAEKVDFSYTTKPGLNEDVVRQISAYKKEPVWVLQKRLKGLEYFLARPLPAWGPDLSKLNLDEITYFADPGQVQARNWEDVPIGIRNTFDRLGIPEAEKKALAGVGAQFESQMAYHNLKEQWEKLGVVFENFDDAIKNHPELVKEYFMTRCVPMNDHKFAALHAAVFSGGTFIYVPPHVKVELPLQAYFRMNAPGMGQFEHTLIVADEGSDVSYIEGCFPKGAKILANPHYKPIEEVAVGEKVLTHNGIYKKVSHIQKRVFSGDLYTITYFGDPTQSIKVTAEHPFLVVKRISLRDRNMIWQREWLKPGALTKRDYLAIPVNREVDTAKWRDFGIERSFGGPKKVTIVKRILMSPEFFRLVGYYLAEGSINNNSYLNLSFGAQERELIDDAKRCLRAVFGIEKIIEVPHEKNHGLSLVVCSVEIARLFKQFGTKCDRKEIPHWLMLEDPRKQRELILGVFRGDGNYYQQPTKSGFKEVFRINTTSEKMARQIRDLLLRQGIVAFLNRHKRLAPRLPLYTVGVTGDFMKQFGDMVGIKVSATMHGKKRASMFGFDGQYAYVPIKSIKKKRVNKLPVYNFGVEGDESYVAHGVAVHNCSAPQYTTNNLHAGCVEIFVKKNARVRYTSIENWSKNTYNLNTKRAIVEENGVIEWINGNLGSGVTMLYPSAVLIGRGAKADFIGVAFAGAGQNQDTGSKVMHLAPYTSSTIIGKSISKDGGITTYRGLLKVNPGAHHVKSSVSCDALLLDETSVSNTIPYMDVREEQVDIGHEAKVGKISAEQLFYLQSRGLSQEQAMQLIVSGFIEPVVKQLPLEYAVELNRLIELEMEGSVG